MSEQSLYDRGGRPTAYIAEDGETIYTWRGKAVCFVSDERLYGWNGRHLGWMVNGVLYDGTGRRVGYTRERCPVACHASPAKSAKHARSAKSARQAARARPALSTGPSQQTLDDFLAAGAR
ncbi:4-fold beta flower protein [Blastococcus litoris]|uniref:4-fold beta flower protein n=1 Tax=Blastococcus litoris TaxID=2171622 RepID=UPI000E302F5B|nr:hypothetical protein [Blastococcus litoris]